MNKIHVTYYDQIGMWPKCCCITYNKGSMNTRIYITNNLNKSLSEVINELVPEPCYWILEKSFVRRVEAWLGSKT